ncbi:S1 family peptidase [Roseibium sp. M-1]
MRSFLFSVVLFFVAAGNALSMDFNDPDAPFNPSSLTRQEIRFLQMGLAVKRHYIATLDGLWGPTSRKALQKFINQDLEADHAPTNADVMLLIVSTVVEFRQLGWAKTTFSSVDLDLLTPKLDLVEGSETEAGAKARMGDMLVQSIVQSYTEMQEAHFYDDVDVGVIFSRRKERLWASVLDVEDTVFLVYSQKRGTRWNTIAIQATREDSGRMYVIFSGLFRDTTLTISPSERFDRLTDVFLQEFDRTQPDIGETARPGEDDGSGTAPAREKDKDGPRGTGTGFAVTADGYLLTNAHVVEGCRGLKARGQQAFIVDSDENFDLALIHSPDLKPAGIAVFADTPAALNSDITTAGYPLTGLLGGLNITRGTVASRKGLGGSGINMQITAPLQPGNSGGPAVNASGLVVGVVVSKLNAAVVAEAIGDIPQNVNFAVRGTIAQLFLHQNGITPQKAERGEPLAPEEIASRLSDYTFLISCF